MGELYNKRIKMFIEPSISLTTLSSSGTRVNTKEYGELLDLESGCWAAVLGHSNERVVQSIKDNIGALFHTHQFFDTEHPSSLVNELVKAANLKSSYLGTFLSSGSEAVSFAVLLAERITGREKKLSFNISYHGTSSELRMPRNTSKWLDLDVLECLSCSRDMSCKDCGKFNHLDFSSMATFVFEPGNSGGLVLLPPDKLISFLCEEVRSNGGLIIANEVTTGFGRTGKWFGFQHYDVFSSEETSPDFIAMGKGLGNGYPVSGVLVKEELARKVQLEGFRYVQSHIDDPLGCIVAREVVKVMVNENLVEAGDIKGAYFRQRLNSIAEASSGIVEVRGIGMMNLAVLNSRCNAREIFVSLLELGFFVGYSEISNTLRFYAPLIITFEEIDAFCLELDNLLRQSMLEEDVSND